MALLAEQGKDVRSVETPRGKTLVYTLAPCVYVTVVSGHLEEAGAELIVQYGTGRVRAAPGKLHVFHDWIEMTGYESGCRHRLTTWTAAYRDSVADAHLALRSKLVAMGVQVANLALGGMIKTHTNRGTLEHALRRAMIDLGSPAGDGGSAQPS